MESEDANESLWPVCAIVDDDEYVARAIRRLLHAHEIHAETFPSGRRFVEVLESDVRFQPACVVLDLHMTDLDGLAVQRHLVWSRPGVPVIFLSGSLRQHERQRALDAGARAVFRKPLYQTAGFLEEVMVAVGRV